MSEPLACARARESALQRHLSDALGLMDEAAALFMGYAEHHWRRAGDATDDPKAQLASLSKARANLLAAIRLKQFKATMTAVVLVPHQPGEDTLVAHGDSFGNVVDFRGVHPAVAPLPDDTTVAGIEQLWEEGNNAVPPLQLTTPDPRFDPTKPVLINGYRYQPATEA